MASKSDKEGKYLAKLVSECCYVGTIHAGTPTGRVVEGPDFEVPTYVKEPPLGTEPNGHIIFYLPDVWGLSNNAKLLIDAYAAAGFLVFGIDYFRGDPASLYRDPDDPSKPVPAGWDREAWRVKHYKFAQEHVPVWVATIKKKYGNKNTGYAAVGYCFGAPFVCEALAQGLVDVGAVAHPAQLKDTHLHAIAGRPLFLSCCDQDHVFSTEERRQAIDILIEDKSPYHLQLFSGVKHGFASRGNLDVPYERWVKEQSLKGIVDWFGLWLILNPTRAAVSAFVM